MELRVTQCEVGRFNLLSNEESFTFRMVLVDENKPLAKITYNGEPKEIDDFKDAFSNMPYIFNKCFGNAMNKSDCLKFAELYNANYDQINSEMLAKRKIEITKEIAILQRELENDTIIEPIYRQVNQNVNSRIEIIKRWVNNDESELSDLKEGTERYNKLLSKTLSYNTEIAQLESLITK